MLNNNIGFKCVHVSGSNNYFVVQSEAVSEGQHFSEIGEGNTLENAKDNSYANLKRIIERHNSRKENTGPAEQKKAYAKDDNSKQNMGGGFSKPISPKQIGFIESMAGNNGETGEGLAHKYFGKNLNELKGSEADTLIKTLKGDIKDEIQF